MSDIDSCQFYCLSFKNIEKRNDMARRFNTLGIDCIFYDGVEYYTGKNINKLLKRQWSKMHGHLDMIHHFYHNSDKTYGIFCEDDIYIHSNIRNILGKVVKDFKILSLDILLLGYLLPYKIGTQNIYTNYKLKINMPEESIFKYHNYPEYLSGTQMYMISRDYAKYILDNYYDNKEIEYGIYFKCDKTIIKDGNRALIYPMLAVENYEQTDLYHQLCQRIHYNEYYI